MATTLSNLGNACACLLSLSVGVIGESVVLSCDLRFLWREPWVGIERGIERYDRLGNINKQKELLERALAINEREYGALPLLWEFVSFGT